MIYYEGTIHETPSFSILTISKYVVKGIFYTHVVAVLRL